MPSFVTPATTNKGRAISRVNSFKREWADEDIPPSSASREVEWSPSPELVKRKLPMQRSPPPVSANETAADRRRRAILEAMSQNGPTPASSSAAPSTSTLPPLRPAPSTSALPSLPLRKRQLPWEDDFTTAKKVMNEGGSRSAAKFKAPSIPTVNIRQQLQLSTEQQKVLTIVVQEGKNVFFTGSAGTGKSVLLREIIKNLRRKHAKASDAVAVTASTGIAACNIGGVTLHSFGGAGLAIEKAEDLVKKIRKNRKAAARWTRTKVLIIDEVSMVDGEMFDKYNKIGQLMRKKPGVPFGGIQIIVTGDFFQLPPVTKGNAEPRFCFEAQTWRESVHMQVNLTKVFRQKDERFVDMLNQMRFGKLKAESIAAFQALSRPIHYTDGIAATELFPRREDVDRANFQRLEALNTEGYSYTAADGGSVTDPAQREKMLANFMAPHTIRLKIDAQVMLIKNVDETLVNGSMGKVLGFCHKIEFATDSHGMWRPQGALEDIEMGEEDDTRKRKLREMLLSKISPNAKPLPVVRFNVPGGMRDMLVEMDSFKNELPNGEIQVSRTQIPLILAWAMSIHKAQGQTLDRVKVDLNKVFEKGQAYVALSRATSLEGLQVASFRADKVMAHRKVAVWSEQLTDLNV